MESLILLYLYIILKYEIYSSMRYKERSCEAFNRKISYSILNVDTHIREEVASLPGVDTTNKKGIYDKGSL